MMTTTAVILVILTLTGMLATWHRRFNLDGANTPAWLATTLNCVAYVCYCSYSYVCSIVFGTFRCRRVAGQSYLVQDLSIDCSSHNHKLTAIYAALMVVVLSVGLPLLCAITTARHLQTGTIDSLSELPRPFRSIFVGYKMQFW
jgi:hypothetical protein